MTQPAGTWEQILTTVFGVEMPSRSDIVNPTWLALDGYSVRGTRPRAPEDHSIVLYRHLSYDSDQRYQVVRIAVPYRDAPDGVTSPHNLTAQYHRETNALIGQLPDSHPNFQPTSLERAGRVLHYVDRWSQDQRALVDSIIHEIGGDQSGFRGTAAEVFVNLLRNVGVNLEDLHTDLNTPNSWGSMLEQNAADMRTFARRIVDIWNDYRNHHFGHYAHHIVDRMRQGLVAGAGQYHSGGRRAPTDPWLISVPFVAGDPLTVNLADPAFVSQLDAHAKRMYLDGLRIRLDEPIVVAFADLIRLLNSTSNWMRLGVSPPPPIPLVSAPDGDGLGGPDLDDLGGGLGDPALDDLGGGGSLGDALDDLGGGGGGLGDPALDDLGGGGGGLGLDGLDGEGGLNLDGLGGAGGGGLGLDGLDGFGGGLDGFGAGLDGFDGFDGGLGLGGGGGGLNLDDFGDLGGGGAISDADPPGSVTGLPPVLLPGQGGGLLGPATGTASTGGGTSGRPGTVDDEAFGLDFLPDDADEPGRGVGTGTVLDGVSIGQLGASAPGVTPGQATWTAGDLGELRAGQLLPGMLGAAAAAPGLQGSGYPFMPPMGGMGGMGGPGNSSDKERERKTWLAEDEETWGTDPQTVPAVIGRGPVPTADGAQRPAGDTAPAGTPARPARARTVRSTTNRPQ